MGCCDKYEAFPHGKSCSTLAAIVLVIVSFIFSTLEFQLSTHIPALVVMIIVLCTTFTTVTPSVLIGASVLCFVNTFFAVYQFYVLARFSDCGSSGSNTTTSDRFLQASGSNATTSTSGDGGEEPDWHAEMCAKLPMDLAYNAFATILWTVSGFLTLQIPQPGNYFTGQTTTFDSAPDTPGGTSDLELA